MKELISKGRTEMNTSEKAKAAGLKNLTELSRLTSQSTNTLRSWDKNKPELFKMVLAGAAERKRNK